MAAENIGLSDSYARTNWAILSLSLALFFYYYLGTEINLSWLPTIKDNALIAAGFYILLWIYQGIRWQLEPSAVKRRYFSISIHLGVTAIVLVTIYFCLPKITFGSAFQNMSFWWLFLFSVLGIVSGFFASILSLAALIIRTKEEAEELSLPILPNASKAQFKVWLPVLLVSFALYFIAQYQLSKEHKLIGAILFIYFFIKEIGIGLIPYYLSQDTKGNRISFREKVSGLKKAVNMHDHNLLMISAYEAGLMSDIDSTLAPAALQKDIVHKLSHRNKPELEAKEARVDELQDRNPDLCDYVQAKAYDLIEQKLKEPHSDVNKTGAFGWTPLCHASANGDLKAISMLLEGGADPDVKNLQNRSPMHFGARYSNFEVCELLLKYGANPNTQDETGLTPLMIAALQGNVKLVNLLIKHNADINIKDFSGQNALHFATKSKAGAIAKILRAHSK